MRTRWISTLLLGCLLPCLLGRSAIAADPAKDDITAIEFLGEADPASHPESQAILIDHLLKDPREEVRFAAVKAITRQIQRGKPPLGITALYGWRTVPDPLILDQLRFLLTFETPRTKTELMELYRDRRFQQNQTRFQHRHDTHRETATPRIKDALLKVSTHKVNDLFYEPSARIRFAAGRALLLCENVQSVRYEKDTGQAEPSTEELRGRFSEQIAPINVMGAGRADTANRLNLFDNMSIVPQTRAWFGFQHVMSQNNAIVVSAQNSQLIDPLFEGTNDAIIYNRGRFSEYTGFGSGLGTDGGGGGPSEIINASDADASARLRDTYLEHNAGRSASFLRNPNTNLYRAGFEYALTPDFGVAVQAQYVTPLDDVEQPNVFSNPIIQMKHLLYRDDETILASMFAVAPQIPTPEFSIVEDTTRLSPGLGFNHIPKEDWFLWGVTGFSLPTDSDQIKTWDYGLGLGHWLYKHESLEVWSRQTDDSTTPFILGIVPQFEVLGKHIMGSNTVTGLFDLSTGAPQTAAGTLNPLDGTRTIYIPPYYGNPEDIAPVQETALFFEEPRHVVDLTMAVTLIFPYRINLTLGLSVPVTGGSSRSLEFLSYINQSF